MESNGRKIVDFIGLDLNPIRSNEGLISGVGGFFGIAAVYFVNIFLVSDSALAIIIVASMGSSAVLLFAAPLSSLTQPWNVFGGHLISAIIGVTCAKYINQELIAAAASVGISVGAMYYLRCVHPPAGATTLFAVIGGPSVHSLGYSFVISPILFNVVVILLAAFIYNAPFSWRRYPRSLQNPTHNSN